MVYFEEKSDQWNWRGEKIKVSSFWKLPNEVVESRDLRIEEIEWTRESWVCGNVINF